MVANRWPVRETLNARMGSLTGMSFGACGLGAALCDASAESASCPWSTSVDWTAEVAGETGVRRSVSSWGTDSSDDCDGTDSEAAVPETKWLGRPSLETRLESSALLLLAA